MKIDIVFTEALLPNPKGKILQMLPFSPVPDWEMLQTYVEMWDVAVITPPTFLEGQYGMACVTPEGRVFQPMCFPDREDILPGTDIYPVSFPWGKLAMCCEADICQPQYARLAALKGCNLMAVAFPWEEEWLMMASAWSVCQANCLPVMLARRAGGQLILPCPMTQDNSGFGRSSFDTDELPAAYEAFPVVDSLNEHFYERYREVLEV